MICKITENYVRVCELVEHPGGADGGEFPQYHLYDLLEGKTAHYSTGFPESPTDTFSDEEADDYGSEVTHEEAADALEQELADAGVLSVAADFVARYRAAAEYKNDFDHEGNGV